MDPQTKFEVLQAKQIPVEVLAEAASLFSKHYDLWGPSARNKLGKAFVPGDLRKTQARMVQRC